MGELALKKVKKLGSLILYDSKSQIENGTAAYFSLDAYNKAEIAAISSLPILTSNTGRIPTKNNGYAIHIYCAGNMFSPTVVLLPGVDLTLYKKLHVESYIQEGSASPIYIVKYTGSYYNPNVKQSFAIASSPYSGYSDNVFDLSLTPMSGEWGVYFSVQISYYDICIYKVWLEP